MQLALIFDEGYVWHFSINREGPKVKEMLLRLPKSRYYFGYSDDKGILYFFHSDERKPITKFHRSLSKEGHKTIKKSKRNDIEDMEYANGLLIGVWFWEYGLFSQLLFLDVVRDPYTDAIFKTEIWSTKRSVWIKGPHLIGKDQKCFSYKSFEPNFDALTGIALNRTAVMLVGGFVYNNCTGMIHRDKVFTVNIQNNVWTKYPDLPSNWYNDTDIDTDKIKTVAALSFEKATGQRYNFSKVD